MAKVIRYKFLSCEVNHGTEENPGMEQIILDKTIECSTQTSYDASYTIAEKEAVPGTIVIEEKEDLATPLTLEERLIALEKEIAVSEYVPGTWYYRGDKALFEGCVYTCIAPPGVVCVWNPLEYPAYWANNA